MTSPSSSTTRSVPKFDSLSQAAFLGLWRTYDRLRAVEEEFFRPFGLTPQQYNALRLLRAAAPQRLPTLNLAASLVSKAPDITRLLDKLDVAGWIERHRPAENRRCVYVGITAEGLTLLERIDPQLENLHGKQLGHMTPEQLRHLAELLRLARLPHEVGGSGWV